jgi:hypothetical protein
MRVWVVALMSASALIVGCQAMTSPSSARTDSAVQAGDPVSSAYQPGPPGIDDDSDFDPPNPVTEAMLSPFRAVGDGFDALFAPATLLIQKASGDTPHKAALQLQDKSSADNRRAGLNRLVDFPYAHRPPYTKVYEGMAGLDEDATVRATALRACNRSRDRAATSVFIKCLADKSELVRLEAAKGLANIPEPRAAVALAGIAGNPDESRDVRIATTDALKYYRTPEVARALCSLLNDRDFSVSWQARRSLVYLTHRDFGYDEGTWLGYFAGPEKPLG